MKIYLLRHGITQSNKEMRIMGSGVDEDLAPEGIAQVDALLPTLATDFDTLFSSPLKRAMQTALPISTLLNIPIITDMRLIERNSGLLAGKTWAEVALLTAGVLTYEKLKANKELDYSAYGGESIPTVRNRLGSFLEDLRQQYSDKKVLVVTHGGIIRVMYNHFGQHQYPPDLHNGSLHEFEI